MSLSEVRVPETEGWKEVLRDLEVLRKDLRTLELDASSELAGRLRKDLLALRRKVRERLKEASDEPVSLAWRKGDFEVLEPVRYGCPLTRVRVSGYRAGPFGVYRSHGHFSLVHIPSARTFMSYKLLRETKAVAAKLSELPVDWTEDDVEEAVSSRELGKRVREVCKCTKY